MTVDEIVNQVVLNLELGDMFDKFETEVVNNLLNV